MTIKGFNYKNNSITLELTKSDRSNQWGEFSQSKCRTSQKTIKDTIIIIIMDLQATDDVTKICKPKVRGQNRT